MSEVVKSVIFNAAHQRAVIRETAGGFALALRAFNIQVFGTVTGDDDTLLGAAVDFCQASCVIAVDYALGAGDICHIEDARRRGMWA